MFNIIYKNYTFCLLYDTLTKGCINVSKPEPLNLNQHIGDKLR